jgi:ferritin-like metal-binding protein YciE
MSTPRQKIIQYLNDAHASEMGLVRVLQSQVAMTPRGTYRNALEKHLGETRDHAERLRTRMRELGDSGGVLQAGKGFAETVASQALALGKTPIDLLRGSGGEEKVLKNARDAAATEALEIATYTAIEQLANDLGDTETARLAVSIRGDEQRMLDRIMREIPKLTTLVVRAESRGNGAYHLSETGAADATRAAGRRARSTAKRTSASASRSARRASGAARSTGAKASRTARRAPGAARATGAAKGAVAREKDLPIARYESLTADEIASRLPELSQVELGVVEAYERKNAGRATVLERIRALRATEPWPGYDDMNVDELRTELAKADESRARTASEYERAHKNRAGVLEATERELSNA